MRLKNGDISLRTDDAFHIFGLENKGKDVMKVIGKVEKEMMPSHFLDPRNGEIVIDQLIENIVKSDMYYDDFVRRTVLVLLSTIIALHSNKHVRHSFYKLVDDVDAIKSFN